MDVLSTAENASMQVGFAMANQVFAALAKPSPSSPEPSTRGWVILADDGDYGLRTVSSYVWSERKGAEAEVLLIQPHARTRYLLAEVILPGGAR